MVKYVFFRKRISSTFEEGIQTRFSGAKTSTHAHIRANRCLIRPINSRAVQTQLKIEKNNKIENKVVAIFTIQLVSYQRCVLAIIHAVIACSDDIFAIFGQMILASQISVEIRKGRL